MVTNFGILNSMALRHHHPNMASMGIKIIQRNKEEREILYINKVNFLRPECESLY